MGEVLRTVIWRNLAEPGTEYCCLCQSAAGFVLEGRVVLALDRAPLYAHYRIDCNSNWHTQAVSVELRQGYDLRTWQIEVDGEQRWWLDGQEVEHIRGCYDVDLAITPVSGAVAARSSSW